MRSSAKDRQETREHYQREYTHRPPMVGGVIRDLLTCLDEIDQAWAEVDQLQTALREIREGCQTCVLNERYMYETLGDIESIVERAIGVTDDAQTDDPWTPHGEAQATIRADLEAQR